MKLASQEFVTHFCYPPFLPPERWWLAVNWPYRNCGPAQLLSRSLMTLTTSFGCTWKLYIIITIHPSKSSSSALCESGGEEVLCEKHLKHWWSRNRHFSPSPSPSYAYSRMSISLVSAHLTRWHPPTYFLSYWHHHHFESLFSLPYLFKWVKKQPFLSAMASIRKAFSYLNFSTNNCFMKYILCSLLKINLKHGWLPVKGLMALLCLLPANENTLRMLITLWQSHW